MTTHAIATLTISSPDKLAAYRERVGAALARHGGALVQAAPDLQMLEGDEGPPDITAILSFPDRAAAQAWIADPELSEVHALRRSAGRSRILLL